MNPASEPAQTVKEFFVWLLWLVLTQVAVYAVGWIGIWLSHWLYENDHDTLGFVTLLWFICWMAADIWWLLFRARRVRFVFNNDAATGRDA